MEYGIVAYLIDKGRVVSTKTDRERVENLNLRQTWSSRWFFINFNTVTKFSMVSRNTKKCGPLHWFEYFPSFEFQLLIKMQNHLTVFFFLVSGFQCLRDDLKIFLPKMKEWNVIKELISYIWSFRNLRDLHKKMEVDSKIILPHKVGAVLLNLVWSYGGN